MLCSYPTNTINQLRKEVKVGVQVSFVDCEGTLIRGTSEGTAVVEGGVRVVMVRKGDGRIAYPRIEFVAVA